MPPQLAPQEKKKTKTKKIQRYFRESDTVVETIHPSGSFISWNSAEKQDLILLLKQWT